MSQRKYDEAKVWLTKYTEKKPDDLKGWTLIESIDKIRTIDANTNSAKKRYPKICEL